MTKKIIDMKNNKKTQWFQASFEVISADKAKGDEAKSATRGTVIKGFASTPTKDRHDDIVLPSAFEETIQKDYKKNPIILFQHDTYNPIGKATYMSISEKGLYIEGLIVDEKIEPKIQAGILKTLSIGYIPQEVEFKDKNGAVLNPDISDDRMRIWMEEGVTRTIKKLELVENSIVSVPANPDAIFDMEKSVKSFFKKEMEQFKSESNKLTNITMKKNKNLLDTKDEEETEAVEKPEEISEEVEKPEVPAENAEEEKPTDAEAESADDKAEEPEESTDEGDDKATDDEKSEGGEGDETSTEEKPEEEETESPEAESTEEEATEEEKTIAKMATKEGAEIAYKALISLQREIKELRDLISKTPAKKALAYIESSVKGTKDGTVTKTDGDKKPEEKPDDEKKGFKKAFQSSVV